MGKSNEEINKIANLLLEQNLELKKELDSLSFIWNLPEGERNKRTKRKLEICSLLVEKAKKITLIEGEITLTDPEEI